MPSTLTHYIFNKGLVSDLKYEDIFLLGGQGADVFFFYGYNFVKIKNKMLVGDEVELITPNEQFITKVESIKSKDGDDLPLGNTNDDVYVKFSKTPIDNKYALVRTVGVKTYQSSPLEGEGKIS